MKVVEILALQHVFSLLNYQEAAPATVIKMAKNSAAIDRECENIIITRAKISESCRPMISPEDPKYNEAWNDNFSPLLEAFYAEERPLQLSLITEDEATVLIKPIYTKAADSSGKEIACLANRITSRDLSILTLIIEK